MPENAGFYEKFIVHRKDRRDEPGGDRQGAVYFTLEPTCPSWWLTLRARGFID